LHILHMIFCFMQEPEKESGIQTEKNWPEYEFWLIKKNNHGTGALKTSLPVPGDLKGDTALDGKQHVFLSVAEAIDAIRTDFHQYPPQRRLFMDLCPLILGPEITVADDPRCQCMWISKPGRTRKTHMRRTTARELGRVLLNALENGPPSAEVLAEICRHPKACEKNRVCGV